MTIKKKENSFEKDLNRLEEISVLLESNSIELEDALNLYEEGIELSRSCISTLKKAELRIVELKKNLDKLDIDEDTNDD